MRYELKLLVSVLCALMCSLPAVAQEPAEADKAKDAKGDAVAAAIAKFNESKLSIQINREEGYVDVDAKVCLRSGEFLEMFMCTPDTREHESILVTDAKPSMMHFALLLLGEQPGKPLKYDMDFDPPKLVPATGPKVQVMIVTQVGEATREIPANRWVRDNKTEEMMKDNTWLFAGSVYTKIEDKRVYVADINGSAISLVNFGDDLLTLANTMTQENDSHGKVWAPRTKAIPKVGTKVTVRLRPLPAEEEDKAEDKAEDGAKEAPKPDEAG